MLFRFLIAFIWIGSSPLLAFDLGAGAGVVEEGDDRYRPTTVLHLGLGQRFFMRSYLYGRKQGPFKEMTGLLSANWKFPLFERKSNFVASVGPALLLEQTSYKSSVEGEKDDSKNQFNAGVVFGCSYVTPWPWLFLSLNWDSHLFLAGDAGILLVTGRKQMLSVATGVSF